MLNATRVAAAIAILTLGAGLVLARVGLQPDSGPVAPGAEATFTVPGEWAFFSGEMRYDGRMPVGAAQPEEYVENGLTIFTQQAGFEGQTFTASDPRLTGARSELETTILEDADAGASIWAERSVIENDDGAWTCVLTSLSRPESEAAGPVPLSGWCDGSEAYDGLHAYLAIHHDDPLPGGALLVTGFVSDVDGPLVPASE